MADKQYYTNLNPGEKSIESRLGSKTVMDDKGNVLFTTSRQTEYLDQLRKNNYQGNINLNPDDEGSYFYVGTGQVDLNQQGNINQESITLENQSNVISPVFNNNLNNILPQTESITEPTESLYLDSSSTSILPDDELAFENSSWYNNFGDNGKGSGFEGTPVVTQEDINFFNSITYDFQK